LHPKERLSWCLMKLNCSSARPAMSSLSWRSFLAADCFFRSDWSGYKEDTRSLEGNMEK
jgi:hypothetical protein